MCGIFASLGVKLPNDIVDAVVRCQDHRGPDADGRYRSKDQSVTLCHNRLSILDLSPAGNQPFVNNKGNLKIVFNGEIYNYLELRRELPNYEFKTKTDTEILLAAYETWGPECLDRLIGMFAFAIWDEEKETLFAARDRFGVKPLFYSEYDGRLLVASEIKAIHLAGVPRQPDESVWSAWLQFGRYQIEDRTFWKGIESLPPGHWLTWKDGRIVTTKWYDVYDRVGDQDDSRSINEVKEEYLALLEQSVRLRFRSDVPVGINLSGGLDSSTLLSIVDSISEETKQVKVFTFVTNDPAYDETPWVNMMLEKTNHPLSICALSPGEVPLLAKQVQHFQDEPFGGLPTLCYAKLFSEARKSGVKVLLDGQGMDEQWAGYDYYQRPFNGSTSVVQGTTSSPTRPDALTPEFRSACLKTEFDAPFQDPLRNLQYRDIRFTKIPRALRFNDRASMQSSCELREPFLDHRMVERALSQPRDRLIRNSTGKWLLRQIAADICPPNLVSAPKRPLQTPQREWLRGPLKSWANDMIHLALDSPIGSGLQKDQVLSNWRNYADNGDDNSFYIWQWISLGLIFGTK